MHAFVRSAAAALIACLCAAMPARAVVVSQTLAFSAQVPSGPVSTVMGSFTVSFDNAVAFTDQATGIVLDALNIALGSPIVMSYNPGTDFLTIGGSANGAAGTLTASDDFILFLSGVSTPAPGFLFLAYQQQDTSLIAASAGSVTVVPTPEPGSLALLAAALAAGAALRQAGRTRPPPRTRAPA